MVTRPASSRRLSTALSCNISKDSYLPVRTGGTCTTTGDDVLVVTMNSFTRGFRFLGRSFRVSRIHSAAVAAPSNSDWINSSATNLRAREMYCSFCLSSSFPRGTICLYLVSNCTNVFCAHECARFTLSFAKSFSKSPILV